MRPKRPKYLTPKELAYQLDVSERTAYRFCENGQVPAFKVGSRWRVPADNYLEKFSRLD
jgi:excisionase family DNA binding protein